MTETWVYDLETFKNLFSGVFLRANTDTDLEEISKVHGLSHPDVRVFAFSEDFLLNDIDELHEFLRGDIELVGFNNKMFDEPVLDYVISSRPTTKEIYNFAQGLISRQNGNSFSKFERQHDWESIDLMKVMAFDKLGVSLKQSSINLQWWRVQDLPYEHDHVIQSNEVNTVLDYNLNDVLISAKLYRAIAKELNLRKELSKEYAINLMSASDSKMANLMLEDIYTKRANVSLDIIRNLRTERNLVWLRGAIGKNIEFKTKKLQRLKRKIENTVVVAENNFAFHETIQFGNCEYKLGVGGLHSVDGPAIFKSDDNYLIQDADVASYYPNIIINNEIKPAHLDSNFTKVLSDITQERVQAKKTDPVKAAGLKITINSIFGKLNSDTFWLQDAKAMLSVTLSGQLYLLMLVEELLLHGIPTISANTDGIVCRIPRELEEDYYKVCKWWEEKTEFELEYTPYDVYVRSDVNNYITKKPNGEAKAKGRYVSKIELKKGYRYPIVPSALYEYFINNIPVEKTIKSSKNILDFCISQKAGRKFQMEFHENDGTKITKLQKNNRFYVTDESSGGLIVKRNKDTDSINAVMATENVVVLNDYDSSIPISNYEIKYEFYIEECYKYIRDIESSEFNLNFINEEISTEKQSPLIDINKEAEILPAKFGMSGGAYRYDEKSGNIYRGIGTINYLTDEVGERILDVSQEVSSNTWLDFLVYNAEALKLNTRQVDKLIRIGYFSNFGSRKKLLELYKEFSKGKNRYNPKLKDMTKEGRLETLSNFWKSIPDVEFPIDKIVKMEYEILGQVVTKFTQLNPRFAVVEGVEFKKGISSKTGKDWKLAILKLRSLAKGTLVDFSIFNRFKEKDFEEGNIIFCNKMELKDGKYGKQWMLESYQYPCKII